jgi:hypothetical protein
MYDIVFISYNEVQADTNWNSLKSRFPYAKRVHGVKGIHQAHVAAANKAFTDMIWIVDADAIVLDILVIYLVYIIKTQSMCLLVEILLTT